MKVNHFIFLLAILWRCSLNAQSLYEKHFIKSDRIIFRLVPGGKKDFDMMRRGPLKVTRTEIRNGTAFKDSVIEDMLMPYWKGDTLNWMKLIRKNKDKAAFAYQSIHGSITDPNLPAPKKTEQEKMFFDLLLLSCDFDADIARASGLYFVDSAVSAGRKYLYKIHLYTSKTGLKELLKIEVDPSDLSRNKIISGLDAKAKRGLTVLKWKAADYSDHYSGYFVERSADSVYYSALNKTPVILIRTQYEKNREDIFYTDTMPTSGKKYFYRIRGINFFGELSDPSNVIACYSAPPIHSAPLIDSVKVIDNAKVFLSWRMEEKSETKMIRKFFLMKSDKDNGNYTVISESESAGNFTDTSPFSGNFYKVGGITYDNDTLFSYSRMAIIIDTIPPSVPVGFKALSDSTGKVRFTWRKNTEKDFQGYKLFKANTRQEEMVQINNQFIKDTFYVDKLNLGTLSKNVYFALSATDSNFNSSDICEKIEVKRPDTIAPVSPALIALYAEPSGVKLNYYLSTSEDVSKHHLYRKNQKTETLLKVIAAGDTLSSFTDSTAEYGIVYAYYVTAFDEDNNYSVSKELSINYETGYRKKLSDIGFNVNRTLKFVSLNWDYQEKNIEKFIIYRGKETEPLTIIKTVEGNERTYIDKTPNIGNIYEYRIKAVLLNGAESIISDAIKVEY